MFACIIFVPEEVCLLEVLFFVSIAALAITNTNLAGSMGGMTWMLLDYRLERKWSAVGFCTGSIVGLVAIVSRLKTPFFM